MQKIIRGIKNRIRKFLGIHNPLMEWYIKEGLRLGRDVNIVPPINFGSEPYLISIGEKTTISFDCAFITHDAATRVIRNLPDGNPDTGYFGPIKIGENCFIGARSTILAGVTIGDNTIIGACSLVNKDIPSNVVAAGNPCKIICTLDEYRKKHKDDFMYMVNLTYERKKEFLLKYFRLNE